MKRITESQINNLAKKIVRESDYGQIKNYMFFSNLEQMVKQAEQILSLDPMEIEEILSNGHDWADDHITVAKENLDQVFDFLMNETQNNDFESDEEMEDDDMVMMEGEISEKKKKNTPTNPKLWQSALTWAKSRYKVCPSAYCNGAAVKRYNSQGGKWKKK
jgi:hypothetical protein